MKRLILIATILFLSSTGYSQVVDTQFGKAEVIGLKHWNLQKLLDTLSVKAPGISVDKCAADLKYIGFPDASVIRYYDKDGKFYSVVTIIEPEYSKFVKYKSSLQDTLPTPDQWEKAIQIFNNNPIEFQIGLLKYKSNFDKTNLDTSKIFEDLNKQVIIELWDFLKNQSKKKDKDIAVWVLNKDGNYLNRIIASTVLINFPESDLVWWSLIESLRDPDGRVSSTAQLILKYFISNNKRDVNWQPVVNSLNYLINGTNPFAFSTVLKIMVETNVSENIIKYLFQESKGYLVLSYLKAKHEEERSVAHDFLKKVFKKDFGYNAQKWEEYIVSFVK